MKVKGSYTIEASLLMGILLPVLVSIIYMGFFLHDRGFLQGAACEAASYASLHTDDDGADIPAAAQLLVSGRTLGVRGAVAKTDIGDRQASISYEGNFLAPGMTRSFFGMGTITVRAQASLTLERPSRRIQKIRGVVKVMDSVRRRNE